MEEFNPPIQTRSNDQLIIIAGSTNGDWQQSAIDQAVAELRKRGISQDYQKSRLLVFEARERRELERRSREDFNWLEKGFRFFLWPRYIFRDWDLKEDGYTLKTKRRKQLIGGGIVFWILMLIWSNNNWKEEQIKREIEIEATDISEWEKNRLPLETIEDSSSLKLDSMRPIRN